MVAILDAQEVFIMVFKMQLLTIKLFVPTSPPCEKSVFSLPNFVFDLGLVL